MIDLKNQIIFVLEKEIAWCEADNSIAITSEEKAAFIKGLRQAIYLIQHVIPNEN